ncbi:GNAT family N-acetyltransferase [Evansella vedderi]|uniref:GNAT family N-acetyltransferase n=1 Tax=Evansella vedderi TaxID=38282 RepID=UPI0027D784A9|nr:GNAT family N-acetyltransferase [Evansella vedderi]
MEIKPVNKEIAWELRHIVMWPDKDLEYVKLADDDQGIHYGLFKNKVPVSVISLFINDGEAQFRKFATLQEEQGKGYGSMLLNYVMAEAKYRGVKRIWCNARENKSIFYKKFGLEETNQRFERGGKSYIIMAKNV